MIVIVHVIVSQSTFRNSSLTFLIWSFQASNSHSWRKSTGRWATVCRICAQWRECRDLWTKRSRLLQSRVLRKSWKSRPEGEAITTAVALSWPCRIWRRRGRRWKYRKAWLKRGWFLKADSLSYFWWASRAHRHPIPFSFVSQKVSIYNKTLFRLITCHSLQDPGPRERTRE